MILTFNHLAVIRAALTYWNDEMSPHPPVVYTAYFEEAIGDGTWIGLAVTELRERLPTCRLRYFRCSPDGTQIVDPLLFDSLEELPNAHLTDSTLIATALVSLIGNGV